MTTQFQFDTSGEVAGNARGHDAPGPAHALRWPDLSPFVQGYVEAMFADAVRSVQWLTEHTFTEPAFHMLAPETLARIMEDCEAHSRAYSMPAADPRQKPRGEWFWKNRQTGMWTLEGWPPLTPYLGDDGKVYLREG